MGTKNISLPVELEAYVDAKVASGEYAHASEVVRDAIRAMMREEAEKLEWLRNAITEGVKSADGGPLISGKELVARVKRRGQEMIATRKAGK
jgi:antitoxin ParD1/3/4